MPAHSCAQVTSRSVRSPSSAAMPNPVTSRVSLPASSAHPQVNGDKKTAFLSKKGTLFFYLVPTRVLRKRKIRSGGFQCLPLRGRWRRSRRRGRTGGRSRPLLYHRNWVYRFAMREDDILPYEQIRRRGRTQFAPTVRTQILTVGAFFERPNCRDKTYNADLPKPYLPQSPP